MITPLPIFEEGRLLTASGNSFSDSTGSDLKPKIKKDAESVDVNAIKPDDLSTAASFSNDADFKPDDFKEEPEPVYEFVPLPPFDVLDLEETNPKIKLEPETPSKHYGADTELDPTHLLKPSPAVSPGSDDDMEPLPLSQDSQDEYPLPSGPIADDFLTLFDEMSGETQVGQLQSYGTVQVDEKDQLGSGEGAKKESVPQKSHPMKYLPPSPQYHWHPYAAYPMPPRYPPLPYAHRYSYPFAAPPVHYSSAPVDQYKRHHRSFADSIKDPTKIIEQKDVTDNDVVCGRGGKVNNHPGNKRFRKLISEYSMKYLEAEKQDKPALAFEIVETVKQRGGRFLVKYSSDGFVESDDHRAREKASQALREGAAQLRKEGYGVPDQALKIPPKIKLPNERVRKDKRQDYSLDSTYSSNFEPPRKKVKSVAV